MMHISIRILIINMYQCILLHLTKWLIALCCVHKIHDKMVIPKKRESGYTFIAAVETYKELTTAHGIHHVYRANSEYIAEVHT